jgi:polyhydroxybutyrate depolymerase
MMRISAWVGCVLSTVSLCACSSSDTNNGTKTPLHAGDAGPKASTEDTRPCETSTLQAGTFNFDFAGVTYNYKVHLPPGYDGTKRTPLVLNWHGLTSNADQQEVFSGMNAVSDEEGFLLVYPNSPDQSWNAGTCCPKVPNRDDLGFGRALVDEISKQACVDSKRVYATGMSNGGFMSHMIGCRAADMFAAVAPVAGKVGIPDCQPSRPMPVMAFHGTADPLVAYDTGSLSGENPPATVPETIQHWADRDGCTQGPDNTFQNGTVTCQTWSKCTAGVTVTLCTAQGEGHCWPGTAFCPFGAFTTDIDASREIAKFFKKFKLP